MIKKRTTILNIPVPNGYMEYSEGGFGGFSGWISVSPFAGMGLGFGGGGSGSSGISRNASLSEL